MGIDDTHIVYAAELEAQRMDEEGRKQKTFYVLANTYINLVHRQRLRQG